MGHNYFCLAWPRLRPHTKFTLNPHQLSTTTHPNFSDIFYIGTLYIFAYFYFQNCFLIIRKNVFLNKFCSLLGHLLRRTSSIFKKLKITVMYQPMGMHKNMSSSLNIACIKKKSERKVLLKLGPPPFLAKLNKFQHFRRVRTKLNKFVHYVYTYSAVCTECTATWLQTGASQASVLSTNHRRVLSCLICPYLSNR